MDRSASVVRMFVVALCGTVTLASCAPAPPATPAGGGAAPASEPAPRQPKTLVVGIRGAINGFAHAYTGTVAGGARGFDEGHSQGLVTAGFDTSRPVPRLAAELPSLDKGTARLLPDGRFLATYPLRRDVKWADGEPF